MSTPGFYPKGNRHKPTLIFFDDLNINTLHTWNKDDVDQILNDHGMVKKTFWACMRDLPMDVHTVHVDIREFPKLSIRSINIGDILLSGEPKEPSDGVEL